MTKRWFLVFFAILGLRMATTAASAAVVDTTVYFDGGNYLSLTATVGATSPGTSGYKVAVSRYFQSATSELDFTKDFSIAFSIRLDDSQMDPTGADRVSIIVGSGCHAPQTADTIDISMKEGQWRALDGDHAAGGTTYYTGVYYSPDVVYDVVLDIHLDTYTYDFNLTDTSTTYTFPGLGWRNDTLSQKLGFTACEGSVNQARQISVDNIAFSQTVVDPDPIYTIVANFDGGNATDVVDAYAGKAGDGWKNAWVSTTHSGVGTGNIVATPIVRTATDGITTPVFANGDGAGTVTSYVSSGIDLVTGGVYDFTVVYDVTNRTYDVTVSDGTTSFTSNDLAWITASTDVGGFLNFGFGANNTNDYRAMSLDNVKVWSEEPPLVYIPGDANKDGYVDGSDATILAGYWQQGTPPTPACWPPASSCVDESKK